MTSSSACRWAAAAWMIEVEREATTTSGLVATVGRIEVEPGAGNVIPGRATLSLDVREIRLVALHFGGERCEHSRARRQFGLEQLFSGIHGAFG